VSEMSPFVLGLDLDGTCADFYGRMREITAEWRGVRIEDLDEDVDWNFDSWGIGRDHYAKLHRFAVTQRQLFETMRPMPGAPQALRRLSERNIRIRVITHRLFIPHFHQTAVAQTVRWLDYHDVPYWDLCFMSDKGDVGAQLYVEDSPVNIEALRSAGKEVIVLDNSTNRGVDCDFRAYDWTDAERLIMERWRVAGYSDE
jgi:beta-phosphoglucomutase-like phosphatase (HAD superfamily)